MDQKHEQAQSDIAEVAIMINSTPAGIGVTVTTRDAQPDAGTPAMIFVDWVCQNMDGLFKAAMDAHMGKSAPNGEAE